MSKIIQLKPFNIKWIKSKVKHSIFLSFSSIKKQIIRIYILDHIIDLYILGIHQ